jgi:hypothetical protein
VKRIRKVDKDFPNLLLELLRNILVCRKGNSQEDHLSLTSVLKRLSNGAGTEVLRQGGERFRPTRVRDPELNLA